MTDKQIIDTIKCRYNTFDGGSTQRTICTIDGCFCDCLRERECHYKQLKRKEQECEELNNTITNLENIRDEFSAKLDKLKIENGKLKQTLAEIKKLVEKEFCRHIECCEFCANSNDCLNQKIIEKINEVDNDRT